MIADLIVVDGDPVHDIRVLQDKNNITTVVKDGRRLVFDEAAVARRWPHERGQTYSVTDLTYELVYGDPGENAQDTDEGTTFAGDDAADLVADVRRREVSSRHG